jgi:hypothetical protein
MRLRAEEPVRPFLGQRTSLVADHQRALRRVGLLIAELPRVPLAAVDNDLDDTARGSPGRLPVRKVVNTICERFSRARSSTRWLPPVTSRSVYGGEVLLETDGVRVRRWVADLNGRITERTRVLRGAVAADRTGIFWG